MFHEARTKKLTAHILLYSFVQPKNREFLNSPELKKMELCYKCVNFVKDIL